MKVAISNLPLRSAHKFRGIGYYTTHLLESLKQASSIEVQEFTNLADIKDADIIHYPWFDLFFHSLPIRKRFPTIVTIHDVIPLLFPKQYPIGAQGQINFMLQKVALRGCKLVITDSQASKRDIISCLKTESNKIAVIPLAADSKFQVLKNDTKILYVKRRYRLPDRFLLYVGDANWIKNLPFLIEGFRQIINIPAFADVKLILVGRVFIKNVENIDHPELISLKLANQLIKRYGLEKLVIRPGQIDDADLVVFYNLATAYVQPSLYEGFGLPVLEAQACGTPVVSSNKGGLPEAGGFSVVYFDPSDIKQFISVIKEILGNTLLQNKLSKLGLEQARKFSWKKVADETKSVYSKVAKKND